MREKARFWAGLALCVAGILTSVFADGRVTAYALGAAVFLAGAWLAARHLHT